MPELPEVETTRRGISPHCDGQRIVEIVVRDSRLRWPVPDDVSDRFVGAAISAVTRRAKYLFIETDRGALLCHLGMSGSLRVVDTCETPKKHDHIDIVLANQKVLRYHDPRRFGCLLAADSERAVALLANLGPEPLSDAFNGEYLFQCSRGRKTAVKTYLMDGRVVVGVGNIYANEALFAAGIRPDRAAGRVSLMRYQRLACEVKRILASAIKRGGTTLRDFVSGEGRPGYFAQELSVYGRGGEPCTTCGKTLHERQINQRATVFCTNCQR